MNLLDRLFGKKKWICDHCGNSMKIEEDYDRYYKILKCPKCFRYAVVGKKKPHCEKCGNILNGVLRAQGHNAYLRDQRTTYYTYTYCTHCGIDWMEILGDRARKDEKGYYYEIRSYNASGHEVVKGIARIYLQETTNANEVIQSIWSDL